MEENLEQDKQVNDAEEYVLLDLNDVCVQSDIPADAPYVLSDLKMKQVAGGEHEMNDLYQLEGLDTLTPMLCIGDHLQLIGEYQETIGTCIVFSEKDNVPMLIHDETEPSETNLIKDTRIIGDPSQHTKQVEPIASLQKILKFRLATEEDIQKANRVPAGSQ